MDKLQSLHPSTRSNSFVVSDCAENTIDERVSVEVVNVALFAKDVYFIHNHSYHGCSDLDMGDEHAFELRDWGSRCTRRVGKSVKGGLRGSMWRLLPRHCGKNGRTLQREGGSYIIVMLGS